MIDFQLARVFVAARICGTGVSLFPASAEIWSTVASGQALLPEVSWEGYGKVICLDNEKRLLMGQEIF